MSLNLVFWAAAWLLVLLTVGAVLRGVALARQRRLAEHRRMMTIAGILVGVFLLAYVVKVIILGREDRSAWSSADVIVLRVHELFVGMMLVAGVWARLRARAFGRLPEGVVATQAPRDLVHRRLGRLAAIAAALALLTATVVFAGMWSRYQSSNAAARGETRGP